MGSMGRKISGGAGKTKKGKKNLAISSGWGPKLTGNLANYANASKGTILLGDIQAHMLKEHAKPSARRQDVVHPSETVKDTWCPRATYHRILACREASDPFLKPAESVGVQLLNIFDEGHYIHDKWQRRLWDMGLLKGQWECISCGGKFNGVSPEKCLSSACGAGKSFLKYAEVGLQAPEYLIYGHADGAVPALNALIEIKSVGPGTVRIEAPDIYTKNSNGQMTDLQGLWKDIKEPFPSHVRQGQLYLALCSLMGLPYDQIIFIYEAKFNQGVKEFAVKYDPEVSKSVLRNCSDIVAALEEVRPDPECPTGTTCKDCEKYGQKKPNSERMVREHDSERKAIRRPTSASTRIVRSS
jgi:hypothetical protein